MDFSYPSVDTMDSTNRSISKKMKSMSNQIQNMNRMWIKNKYNRCDNDLFKRMSMIYNRVSDIQDELNSICEIMKMEIETENSIIPEQIIITGKEFRTMNELFLIYMSGAKIE